MAGHPRSISSSRISNLLLLSILLNIHVSMVNCSFCGHPRFSHATDPLDLSSQFATGEPPRPPVTVMFAQKMLLEEKEVLAKNGSGKTPSASDTKSSTLRIVGGMDVNDDTGGFLCWQVSIQMKTVPGLVRCGGSIIGSRKILTAAHCVTLNRGAALMSPTAFIVMVGALDSAFNGSSSPHGARNCGQSFNLAKIIRHPQYDHGTLGNDIAVLILDRDIDINAQCSCPVCLPTKEPSVGEWCVNSGYGQESDSGSNDRVPLPLKFIYQQILKNFGPKCHYTGGQDGNNFLCAGGIVGTDNCYGDSGGPLVCFDMTTKSYYQSGVVSFGVGKCGSGQGSRYTNVFKYLDFIRSGANGNLGI
ncbi:hypothetical protein RvY_16181-1 [Ramazzottius varieornatus]|uniref:Peptidase S1 domain-containing protein n=1 Tax=Ramazzottius varieornatus TaxID=947166 RepID=A0A1D1W0H5_RAMVA|nr:hypothetical protein RvY_16181-1 [Ramazzottius varieornatus]